jgi:hypothetical protein
VPRLVLIDDEGREQFSGEIPADTYAALLAVYQRHRGALSAVAAALRVVRAMGAAPPPELADRLADYGVAVEYSPPRARPRARRGRR